MRVLFDVTHPALVHLFAVPGALLRERGHEVVVAAREKDVTTHLLDAQDLPYTVVSRAGSGPLSRVGELLQREVGLARLARGVDPDVVVSQVDPAAVHVARLVGARAVVFDDSEPEHLAASITHPFADVVCTPANFRHDVPNQRRYDGFHELAYLHPNRFSPDSDVLREHGVDPDEPYAVVRFVSWSAHHDVGRRGFSLDGKRELLAGLAEHGRVFVCRERVTAEGADVVDTAPIPGVEPCPVPPEALHDLLAFADCYVGDSQTMATEAAVLGTPAVRSNGFAGADDMSNFHELEDEYGLLTSVADEGEAGALAVETLRDPPHETHARRRDRLVREKIDVAAFVADVVEGTA
ncbi:DUF354 domain-containing protein [Halobaculum marinum]|uniref:DUF354 domain-containing protein n=1 Tax=Halobaculum marinum TaxID=3031996 RepID=A0ABD5WY01_9EURY|nr:DUF354 domain-containing protein [Halobaculum sp. DT55]